MEFKFGELFCGPGGLGLGAVQASVQASNERHFISHSWAVDSNKDACQTYNRNVCPNDRDSVICSDVRQLDFSTLPAIDAFMFGFPCNDFSVVGEKKGMDGVYGPLYSYGIHALHRFRPQWFLAENVGGLRSANDGMAFQTILEEMQQAGYEITPHLYRFEEYNVPQSRHRIVIVGIRSDIGFRFRVPAPLQTPPRTAREAIEQPPIPEDASNNERTKQSPQVVERLAHIKPGENAFTADLPENLRMNVKGANISQIYKRLDPDKPAYTVTGSGGGGTHVYHWHENRALTNREKARLQTFPDDFVFAGSKESVRRQIGMALPPEGARVILEAILRCFADIRYSNVKPNIALRTDYVQNQSLQPRLLEKQSAYRSSI